MFSAFCCPGINRGGSFAAITRPLLVESSCGDIDHLNSLRGLVCMLLSVHIGGGQSGICKYASFFPFVFHGDFHSVEKAPLAWLSSDLDTATARERECAMNGKREKWLEKTRILILVILVLCFISTSYCTPQLRFLSLSLVKNRERERWCKLQALGTLVWHSALEIKLCCHFCTLLSPSHWKCS